MIEFGEPELKPCPFCGARLERREMNKRYCRYENEVSYIHPDNGCVILKWRISTPEEFRQWNERVKNP